MPSNSDNIYFTINEVAKQVGVVPATIRNWEKAGLITIRRSPSGYRIFDLNDIEFLKKIKTQSKDNNIGIKGIRMLCPAPHAPEPASEAGQSAPVSMQLLSSKWKESRLKKGYSLDDVARLVGISPSYLSKIENAQANVSYDILQKLAHFYGENILYYLGDSPESKHIVKRGTAENFGIGIEGLNIEQLIALQNHTLSALLYTVEPGSGRSEASSHSGEEFVYVLSGKVEFTLEEGQKYILSAGDSLCYQSEESHAWYNCGNRTARLLWVYTPLTTL